LPRLIQTPLTQKAIDAKPLPSSGCTILRDTEQRGLTLRIWPSGTRSWAFEYKSPITLKTSRQPLPEGSLAAARIIAKQYRATIALGRDPALEAKADLETRREAHARNVPVGAVFEQYEKFVMLSAPKPTSRRNRLAVLKRALAGFETRAVASLTRGDLVKRLDEIQVMAGDVSRNRAQSELRHFLGWCRNRDIVPAIALDRVRRDVRETPRARVLTDDELRALLTLTGDGSAYSDLVRTLVYSAMRRNEAASLQTRDLDFDAGTITVREEVSKTRIARTIPMSTALVESLRERARGLPPGGYVFGEGSGFKRPFSGFSKSFDRLKSTGWTLHDLRRTCATRMHELDVDALAIDDLLGHVRHGVRGIYNRSVTLSRQREAIAKWTALLAALERET
jgi:integrase